MWTYSISWTYNLESGLIRVSMAFFVRKPANKSTGRENKVAPP